MPPEGYEMLTVKKDTMERLRQSKREVALREQRDFTWSEFLDRLIEHERDRRAD